MFVVSAQHQSRALSKQREIDSIVQSILSWMLELQDTECSDEMSLVLMLSSILRIYCIHGDDCSQQKDQRQLHVRVKGIGLCVVLHAVSSKVDDDRDESASLVRSTNNCCVPFIQRLQNGRTPSSVQGLLVLQNLSDELRNRVRCKCLPLTLKR